MDSKILLGKILQRFKDRTVAKVEGYKSFVYIRETENSIFVGRENSKDARIPFEKILTGIDAYKADTGLYKSNPTALRKFGITHITSPVFALLHLLDEEEFT